MRQQVFNPAGRLPATIWAVYGLGQYKTDKKIERRSAEGCDGGGWHRKVARLHSISMLAAQVLDD